MPADTQQLHDHQTVYIAQKKRLSFSLKNISGTKEK